MTFKSKFIFLLLKHLLETLDVKQLSKGKFNFKKA